MRRTAITGAVALAATMTVGGPAVGGPPERAELCHYDADSDQYVLLSLPPNGHEAHTSNHADDILPNSDGDCALEPPPVLLARAFTTMSDGYERLIAQLVDVDESGTITAGDVIEVAGFPDSMDADPGEIGVAVDSHVLPADAGTIEQNENELMVIWDRDGDEVLFWFVSYPDVDVYAEFMSSAGSYAVDSDGGGGSDELRVSSGSPSQPHAPVHATGGVPGDAPFIDVEIYLPSS